MQLTRHAGVAADHLDMKGHNPFCALLSQEMVHILDALNLFFTCTFLVEAAVKVLSPGWTHA